MSRFRASEAEAYLVTMTPNAHQEVVWLDISVDEVLCVHILDSANHLLKEKNSPCQIKPVKGPHAMCGLLWKYVFKNPLKTAHNPF